MYNYNNMYMVPGNVPYEQNFMYDPNDTRVWGFGRPWGYGGFGFGRPWGFGGPFGFGFGAPFFGFPFFV